MYRLESLLPDLLGLYNLIDIDIPAYYIPYSHVILEQSLSKLQTLANTIVWLCCSSKTVVRYRLTIVCDP